jgi:cytochrome P450
LDLEEKHVQNLLQTLAAQADGWTLTTDIQPLISRFTMDSASEFLFGESTNIQLSALSEEAALKTAEDRAFVEAFEACQDRMARALLLNEFYSLVLTKKHESDCRLCHRYIDRFVHQALSRDRKPDVSESGNKQKYVFLDSLVNETRDPVEIRNQLLSILIAGRDTTASLLSFLFLMLVQHPGVFDKLRSIIIQDFGTFESPKNLTFADLKACSYLQWCINETLRLYPSVPLNGRRCTRDTSLPSGGGEDGQSPVFIPAGTEIGYLVYVMHRQPDFWGPDADTFRPERWQNHKYGFEYLPFNGGPR